MVENFMAKMSYFWQFSAPCLRGLLCMGKQEVGNRGGGCSGAVKNTNTTHNLAFTFLLSSSKHRQLLKGCTVQQKALLLFRFLHSLEKHTGYAGCCYTAPPRKKRYHTFQILSISSIHHYSKVSLQQHPVVTLSSPPIIIQLYQVRILSQRQNKSIRYQVLDTCNDQTTELKTIMGFTGFFRWCSVFFIT